MRLGTLTYLYARRLRTHPVQELLAGLGVTTGVALAFAVLIANGNVVGSAAKIARGVTGPATVQLVSRDDRGFDARLLTEARRLPGVAKAAPVLEQRAVLVARNGHEVPVLLASMDGALANLSGGLTAGIADRGLPAFEGVMLTKAAAAGLRVSVSGTAQAGASLLRVRARVHGRQRPLVVIAVLGEETVGPVANAQVGLMSLPVLQRLSGVHDRLTRVLVTVQPGRQATVRAGLRRLAGGRITVADADADVALLQQATGASDQATGFFAVLSVILGLLLAAGAMLMTAPERRRMVAELRLQGFARRQLVAVLAFQAVVLGTVASVVGLLFGAVLSRILFGDSAGYLAQGFTLGTDTVVGVQPIFIAFLGGVVSCCVASAPPLLDLRRHRALDAVFNDPGAPGHGLSPRVRGHLVVAGTLTLFGAVAMLVLTPRAAVFASALLVVGMILVIPAAIAGTLRTAEGVAGRVPRLNLLVLALFALRSSSLRSLALAATGAVAVFGSVAIGGARQDLLRGIGQYTADYVGTADLWVVNDEDNQATGRIAVADVQRQVQAVDGVAAARSYYGSFLDAWGRRVWVIARSKGDASMVPVSQMVRGDTAEANRRLRAGGWVVVSDQLARLHRVDVGDTLTIPTPTGEVRLRLAATTTNLGWAPGTVIMSGVDYRRAWATSAPSAVEVDVTAGADLAVVRTAIERSFSPDTALRVQTASERAGVINASARQGLDRLSQISLLLLLAAVLAMATATGAALWQRRASLAALRIQSVRPGQLWSILLLESSLVLGVGCLAGATAGVVGQFGADRYLGVVTGFPVAPWLASWHPVVTVLIVVVAALSVVAVPGWFASRAPVRLGFNE